MKAEIKTFSNDVAGEVNLPDEIFAIEPRQDIIARVVAWQLAKRHAGNHAVKGRSQIAGTNKKPYRQKGTGNARQGTLKAPQYRTGGVVFGPVVRSHAYSLPKKVRKLGLKSALAMKCKEGDLIVLKSGDYPAKTKEVAKNLKALSADTILLVDSEVHDNLSRSVKNLPDADILPVIGLNVYDIMKHKRLALTEESLKALKDRLS